MSGSFHSKNEKAGGLGLLLTLAFIFIIVLGLAGGFLTP